MRVVCVRVRGVACVLGCVVAGLLVCGFVGARVCGVRVCVVDCLWV